MRPLVLAALAVITGFAPAGVAGADESRLENGPAPSGLKEFLRDQRASVILRSDYFQSSRTLDDETGFWGATTQVKALPSFTETIDGKLEARVANPNIGDGGDTRSRLLEGYITAHFAKADVRVGKQIVAWGRADGINPTDNLTPRDFVVLLPFEDDQRFGTTAVKLSTYLSDEHTFTVFTTPFFEPSKVPLSAAGSGTIERRPARTLSNSELGLKLDVVGGGLDWSVSYFNGYSLFPDARIAGNGAAGPVLELHYDRIHVLGADFARNYGRFGFRGEVAYVDTADDMGTDPGAKNPYLFWIVGVDRTFLENMNVNFQFFQRRVRRYHNPEAIADPIEREAAVRNAILDGQQDRVSNGVSFRISNKWLNDTLEAEIFTIANFTRCNNFIRPLLTYAFNDHFKGTIGGDFYHGAANTAFGGLRANHGVFAELRYGF